MALDGVNRCTCSTREISLQNIFWFIDESASEGKLNHQEAQLLRSLAFIEYGKRMRSRISCSKVKTCPIMLSGNSMLSLRGSAKEHRPLAQKPYRQE